MIMFYNIARFHILISFSSNIFYYLKSILVNTIWPWLLTSINIASPSDKLPIPIFSLISFGICILHKSSSFLTTFIADLLSILFLWFIHLLTITIIFHFCLKVKKNFTDNLNYFTFVFIYINFIYYFIYYFINPHIENKIISPNTAAISLTPLYYININTFYYIYNP